MRHRSFECLISPPAFRCCECCRSVPTGNNPRRTRHCFSLLTAMSSHSICAAFGAYSICRAFSYLTFLSGFSALGLEPASFQRKPRVMARPCGLAPSAGPLVGKSEHPLNNLPSKGFGFLAIFCVHHKGNMRNSNNNIHSVQLQNCISTPSTPNNDIACKAPSIGVFLSHFFLANALGREA